MSELDGTLNDATPRLKEVVSPSMVDDTMEKEKLIPVVTTTESYPPLPTQVATSAGNAPGKSSYANVTSKPSGKKLNFHTLFTPGGNGIDVVVLVESIRTISDRFANTTYGFSWESGWHTLFSMDGLDAMLENGPWFIRNNPLILKKWHPDENLLKEDVRKEKMNNSARSNKEVSSQRPAFEWLTSIDNDVDLGTNGRISNSGDKGTINFSSSNTPIGEKIDIIERQIYEGKLRFVDDDGNPLVPTGIVDSDSEVEVVFDETANLRISISSKKRSYKGYGTNSLSEQWRDSNLDNDNYDTYDNDMYENHDMSEHLQSICDNLDIIVRGRKKKYIF
ncbi:hypothetical protein Tco_1162931 [Tanacetum coccineum]